jgi:hypothetical protein
MWRSQALRATERLPGVKGGLLEVLDYTKWFHVRLADLSVEEVEKPPKGDSSDFALRYLMFLGQRENGFRQSAVDDVGRPVPAGACYRGWML